MGWGRKGSRGRGMPAGLSGVGAEPPLPGFSPEHISTRQSPRIINVDSHRCNFLLDLHSTYPPINTTPRRSTRGTTPANAARRSAQSTSLHIAPIHKQGVLVRIITPSFSAAIFLSLVSRVASRMLRDPSLGSSSVCCGSSSRPYEIFRKVGEFS